MIKMARRKFEVGRTSYSRPVVFNLENLRKMAHSPKKNKQVVKAICIISGTKVSPKSPIVDPESRVSVLHFIFFIIWIHDQGDE